jgi:hypothetical protein
MGLRLGQAGPVEDARRPARSSGTLRCVYIASAHPDRPGLFLPASIDPAGEAGPSPHEARGPGYRRTSRGLYLPAEITGDASDQRILEAWAAIGDRKGVTAITGWAALRWLGASWFDGTLDAEGTPRPVDVVSTTRVRSQPGIAATECRVDLDTLLEHDGITITDPWTSVAFEARRAADLRAAVVAIEMAAYDDLVSVAEMVAVLERQAGLPGVNQLRDALGFVDENSGSPQEPLMKLSWILDAGLPRPLCNVPVFLVDGRHLATPDLFDPVAGVVGEYDGVVHLKQRKRDRDREEKLRDAGLEYFTVLAGDLGTTAAIRRMHAARQRAGFEDPVTRKWTVEPPYWWTPTETVAQRRALSEEERRRLLGYRIAS